MAREIRGIDATQSNLLHRSQRKRKTRCLCWRPVPGLSCRTSGTASLRRSRRRRWFGSAVANAPDPAAGQPFLNPALLGSGQSRRVAAGVMRKAVAVSQPGGGFFVRGTSARPFFCRICVTIFSCFSNLWGERTWRQVL
jgi:hypothetical protein